MNSNIDPQKELQVLSVWYEAYMKIIRSIGTIGVTIIFFTANFLLKDFLTGSFEEEVTKEGIKVIKQSFLFFSISLVFIFLCLIFTYNWYRTGIALAMHKINEKGSVFKDKFWYHRAWLPMGITGTLSWVFGGLGAITMIIGIVFFALKISYFLDLFM